MGLFGNSSNFDVDIEKATNENNTTDQWGLIMEICDRVGTSPVNAKECLRSIMKRMAHNDPHVAVQAITLLDACMNNCGKTFHLEVASREFEQEFRRLHSKQRPAVAKKMATLVKKWGKNLKEDRQLGFIHLLYMKLVTEKVEFETEDEAPKTKVQPVSKDPNVVSTQQEMDDIAKAIELSLKDSPMKHAATRSSPQTKAAVPTSLYPTTSLSGNSFTAPAMSSSSSASSENQARKVRALYDFEAAEDNELNFVAGDIIHVTDDSDPNWWKGYNQRGEGLFPASFVTADLSVEPESMRFDLNKKTGNGKKSVQFVDDLKQEDRKDEPVTVNEEQLDRLLHLLHEANPEDPSTDTDEMLKLENVVNRMGPLIDMELERVDRTHAQLTRLSVGLVDAFNLYHTLMRESEKPQYMGYHNPQALYGGPNMHGMPGQYALGGAVGGPQTMPNMMMNPTSMYNQQPQSGMTYHRAPGGLPGGPIPQQSFPMGPPSSSGGMVMSGQMVDPATLSQSQVNPGGMYPQQISHMQHPPQSQPPPLSQHSHPAVMGSGLPQQTQSPVMAHQQQHHHHQNGHQQNPMMQGANTTTSNSITGGVPITNTGYLPGPQQQHHEDPSIVAGGGQGGLNYQQQSHHQVQLPGGGQTQQQQQPQQIHPMHGMQPANHQFSPIPQQPQPPPHSQYQQPGNGDGSSPHHAAPLNHHPSPQHHQPNGMNMQQMPTNYNNTMYSGGAINMQHNMPQQVAAGLPIDMNNAMYQQR